MSAAATTTTQTTMGTRGPPKPAAASEAQTTDGASDGDYVRPLQAGDVRMAKMLIGAGIMEGLARANKQVFCHPLVLIAVVALGLLLNRVLNFKSVELFRITALAPLIGPALVGLPVLGAIEYAQRWPFLARMRAAVGAVDLVNPLAFYGSTYSAERTPHIWVFEHNGELSGVVALDTRQPGKVSESVLGAGYGELAAPGTVDLPAGGTTTTSPGTVTGMDGSDSGPRKGPALSLRNRKAVPVARETPTFAEIRHLAVDAQVRKFGIGTELLATALDAAFAIPSIERVVVLTSPYTPGGDRVFAKCGFAPVVQGKDWRVDSNLGLLRKRGRWMGLDRASWAGARAAVFGSKL